MRFRKMRLIEITVWTRLCMFVLYTNTWTLEPEVDVDSPRRRLLHVKQLVNISSTTAPPTDKTLTLPVKHHVNTHGYSHLTITIISVACNSCLSPLSTI